MENDLISREDALALIKSEYLASLGVHDRKRASGFQGAYQLLYDLPAVDAAPVVHGRWEFPVFTDNEDGLDPRVKCSACGGVEAAFARWKYCPNCGAKMDGGNNDAKI